MLNLPMVCEPTPWHSKLVDSEPYTLSDLSGGYLSEPTGEIYHRYRLLTSHSYSHFHIIIRSGKHKDLCEAMTSLQKQPFEINGEMLSFIMGNRERLEELGLLLPSDLATFNVQEASDTLRRCYTEDNDIKKLRYIVK